MVWEHFAITSGYHTDAGRKTSLQNGSGRRPSQRPGIRCQSCVDGFLQLLPCAECDLLTRLDLDRLARCGVTAHASGALADLQNAEAADANPVALLEMLDDEIDHAAEDRLSLLFRKLVAFGDVRREVLQRNGRCSRLGWSGRHGYSSPCCQTRWNASYARPISDSHACDYVETQQWKSRTGKLLRIDGQF